MVEMKIVYQGDLHCEVTHGPSGAKLVTDAPVDNQGKGESFSPTDLVATALGTCIITTMGIVARRHNIDLSGTTITVQKEMVSQPSRRIGKLSVQIHVPHEVGPEDRQRLEQTAHACPVARSMHPDVLMPTTFKWGK
jgi:putative redox protein